MKCKAKTDFPFCSNFLFVRNSSCLNVGYFGRRNVFSISYMYHYEIHRMPSLPLAKRPIDIVLIIFFCVNLFFITYIVDLEQLVIADANHFQYPVWPPSKMVDLVHWYGNNFDPLLIARPAWWRATIWIDALFFGPFYVFAIYAYAKGKNWIRFASIVWASVMLTNVSIILFEEVTGGMPHHAWPVYYCQMLPGSFSL